MFVGVHFVCIVENDKLREKINCLCLCVCVWVCVCVCVCVCMCVCVSLTQVDTVPKLSWDGEGTPLAAVPLPVCSGPLLSDWPPQNARFIRRYIHTYTCTHKHTHTHTHTQ